MATPMPSGNAMSMAKKLTHNVPKMSGNAPNSGAGVEVGNHSRPPKKSATEMLPASTVLMPLRSSGRYCSGKKARMPSSPATTSASLSGRNS